MRNKNGNTNHSRMFLSGISILLKGKEAETPDRGTRGWIKAFTLIELLVVVLIIGILAAVAVPQYQVAVDKARVSILLPVMRHVKEMEELYKLHNGQYTANWEELGADIPYTSINTSKDTITLGNGYTYHLSKEGTYWHVNGNTGTGTAYLYLAFGTDPLEWLCYPANTDRGRKLCKSLGCADASGTSCGFTIK